MARTKKKKTPERFTADVTVYNHGTLVQFFPLSDVAKEWTAEHVNIPGYAWMGNSFCVEHRYAEDLIHGYRDQGFTVHVS